MVRRSSGFIESTRGHSRHTYPADKMIPKDEMEELRSKMTGGWTEGKPLCRVRAKSTKALREACKVRKKMHTRKSRQHGKKIISEEMMED